MTITELRHDHTTQPNDSRGRGAFNAWFFDTFDRYINVISGPSKRAAFGGMTAGRKLCR